MKKIKLSVIYAFIALLGYSGMAQTKEKDSIKGNPELPSTAEELEKLASYDSGNYTYSVEDYFKKPNKSSFSLSPNGKYLSYKQKDEEGKNHVYIKNTTTDEVRMVLEEKEQLILTFFWANNNTILYVMDKGGDENYHLYSYNIDTKKDMDLTPFEGVKLSTVYALKDLPRYVIVPLNKRNKQVFEPYKINVETGDMELVIENIDENNPINSYKFDSKGNLRALTRRKNGVDDIIEYKAVGEETFKEISNTNWKDTFSILNFVSEDSDLAYVLTNLESDKEEVVLYDLKNKKIVKRLFSNDDYDISGISLSKKRNYELDFYSYNGEKGIIVPVSEYFKKLHKKLKDQFAPNDFSIVSNTENEDKYLIYVTSDVLYGKYYQYNVKTNTFKMLEDLMPQLNPDDMAKMTPISFISRDGFKVHGYLTLPKNAKAGKTPLIVNPHGGPYGIRDSWGYNSEAQLFASRGYATLKINYRGSGGYGKAFYLAGNKQIGRNMLNDLEDGVKYVIEQGIVDKSKIAIYGGSYGGLATLGSLIKTPDLYVCGVDYVGVSNFFTFIESFPAYWKPLMKQFYEQWYDPEIPEEKEIMTAVSPALNIDKLNKPVFVIQGANDPRVNINESDQIVSSLRKKGFDVPYMVKYNEGHGFGREENRIELYKTMLGFFAKHLK
ncbi:S9 family peptidase [Aureibaculum sp. 2210JD6-5]|uniref:alpha/beta hydrolase family protein n=1 Tax=Aureibaculum sp. 2210JD6-5 TaxID=3103957 RepID=UPI002AAE2E56|nr:S9 family peptidase [Aureibaculum sp. 2210JD6-5]MDY7394067.1 S9 family peptidase [Aureibaculum sp. 2210JD6-5]